MVRRDGYGVQYLDMATRAHGAYNPMNKLRKIYLAIK